MDINYDVHTGYPGIDLSSQQYPASHLGGQQHQHGMPLQDQPALQSLTYQHLPPVRMTAAPHAQSAALTPLVGVGGAPLVASSRPTVLPDSEANHEAPHKPFWVHPGMLDSAQDSRLRPSLA